MANFVLIHFPDAKGRTAKDADAFLGLLRALEPGAPRDDVPARFARLDVPHDGGPVFANVQGTRIVVSAGGKVRAWSAVP